MKNMKRILFLAALAVLFLSAGFAGRAGSPRTGVKAPADTLVINTTDLCKDVIGFDGPTPLKITVVKGVVASVEALPNTESPSYFQRVLDGGLLKAVVGKKPVEAVQMPLDAVSGATYSSEAVIENLRAGLKEAMRR